MEEEDIQKAHSMVRGYKVSSEKCCPLSFRKRSHIGVYTEGAQRGQGYKVSSGKCCPLAFRKRSHVGEQVWSPRACTKQIVVCQPLKGRQTEKRSGGVRASLTAHTHRGTRRCWYKSTQAVVVQGWGQHIWCPHTIKIYNSLRPGAALY